MELRDAGPCIVGISGRSQAGKSTIAHALARSLIEDGISCLRVRLDNWIRPAEERTPHADAEARNRVAELPAILVALRTGTPVSAPGYDPVTRSAGPRVTYHPAGRRVIILEGCFATHRSIRDMIDVALFVEVPAPVQQSRFAAFYRWKGFDQKATESLWRQRCCDEWPAVDAQRETADLVI